MSISANYPNPVTVNGYSCKNCTDVDYAKKNIDPQHPKDGPYGVAKTDHTSNDPAKINAPKADGTETASQTGGSPAVTFGGTLSALSATLNTGSTPSATQGHRLDLSV